MSLGATRLLLFFARPGPFFLDPLGIIDGTVSLLTFFFMAEGVDRGLFGCLLVGVGSSSSAQLSPIKGSSSVTLL